VLENWGTGTARTRTAINEAEMQETRSHWLWS